MRIAILSCFNPFRGGIAQFNSSLYEELSRGNEVKAFNFSRQYPSILFPGKTQYVTEEDMTVSIEAEALLDTVNPFSWVRTARAIAKWKPDILIMRYWMPFFAPSLGFVARRLKKKCKVIAILDNVIPHERRPFDIPLTRYFLRGTHAQVTLCTEVAGDLRRIYPDAQYKVSYHPLYSHFGPKIDRTEAEDTIGIRHGMKNILFFGLIREYKGLDILLMAFNFLHDDYQLIIAGEPYGSFEPYQKLIDASTGKDRIKVIPEFIPDSRVREYFSAADVTVLPYRSATQSGVSSVSYHFDVPMIVTSVGGLEETIGERGTGLVCDSITPEAVAAQIKLFFDDASIRESCIGNIQKEKERLSWRRFADGLLEFAETL